MLSCRVVFVFRVRIANPNPLTSCRVCAVFSCRAENYHPLQKLDKAKRRRRRRNGSKKRVVKANVSKDLNRRAETSAWPNATFWKMFLICNFCFIVDMFISFVFPFRIPSLDFSCSITLDNEFNVAAKKNSALLVLVCVVRLM